MAEKMRQFLYLDQDLLNAYAASLQDGLADGRRVRTQSSTDKTLQGGLKAGVVQGGGEHNRARLDEEEIFRRVTPESLFQELFAHLEHDDDISFIDDLDGSRELRRQDIADAFGTISVPTIEHILQGTGDFGAMVAAIQGTEGPISSDPEFQKLMGMIGAVQQLFASERLAIKVSFDESTDPGIVALLDRTKLQVPLSELVGEGTLFGKVQKIVPKGKQFPLVNFMTRLSNMPRVGDDIQKAIDQSELDPMFTESIDGPVAIVTPLAIYR